MLGCSFIIDIFLGHSIIITSLRSSILDWRNNSTFICQFKSNEYIVELLSESPDTWDEYRKNIKPTEISIVSPEPRLVSPKPAKKLANVKNSDLTPSAFQIFKQKNNALLIVHAFAGTFTQI